MWIEKDILPALAGTGRAKVYHTKNWWSQVKTAGAAIYANRHYLELFRRTRPGRHFYVLSPSKWLFLGCMIFTLAVGTKSRNLVTAF